MERPGFWRFFFVDTHKLLSQVWIKGVSGCRIVWIRWSEKLLTVAASLERVWPVGVADYVFRKMRASLDLGPQQVALVEEQDDRGIRQQFIRDNR